MTQTDDINRIRMLQISNWTFKWIALSGLIAFLSFPILAQQAADFSNKPLNHKGFSIYSSETHEMVQIDNLAEWEQYRWRLKQNMEAVMGKLPKRHNLPELDIRIKDSLQTDLY